MGVFKLVLCGCPTVADDEPTGSASSSAPKKHRCRSSRVQAAATTWQPSLGAISEDGMLFSSLGKTAPPPPGKPGKDVKKSSARRTSADRQGEDWDGFRYNDPGVPTFAPTLFMF